MTIEPQSWLIDVPLNDQIEMISHLKYAGVLVPDSRLQAIADAWNEDNTSPAKHEWNQETARIMFPTLTAMLDSLAEVDDG